MIMAKKQRACGLFVSLQIEPVSMNRPLRSNPEKYNVSLWLDCVQQTPAMSLTTFNYRPNQTINLEQTCTKLGHYMMMNGDVTRSRPPKLARHDEIYTSVQAVDCWCDHVLLPSNVQTCRQTKAHWRDYHGRQGLQHRLTISGNYGPFCVILCE